jgi:hypothetical protein
MNELETDTINWKTRQKDNTFRLMYWTSAWVVTTAIAIFGPKLMWDYATLPTIAGVLFNLAVGFGMILANKQHLQSLDEMHRKIFLEAGILTLGVGLVCGLSYALLESTRLITFQPEISHLIILMALTFLGGTFAGHRKYR